MAKQYQHRDHYHERAKKEGYAARSVYKLEEIADRFDILRRGARVLDLGCAPGSWMQFTTTKIGDRGLVVGYDIEPTRVGAPNARTFVTDVHALTPEGIRADLGDPDFTFDVVLSDMAPKTTGIRDADQARSIGLVEHALSLAQALLAADGSFLAKVFQGRGFDDLLQQVRASFSDVRAIRPKATRHGSREAFILARGRRTG